MGRMSLVTLLQNADSPVQGAAIASICVFPSPTLFITRSISSSSLHLSRVATGGRVPVGPWMAVAVDWQTYFYRNESGIGGTGCVDGAVSCPQGWQGWQKMWHRAPTHRRWKRSRQKGQWCLSSHLTAQNSSLWFCSDPHDACGNIKGPVMVLTKYCMRKKFLWRCGFVMM